MPKSADTNENEPLSAVRGGRALERSHDDPGGADGCCDGGGGPDSHTAALLAGPLHPASYGGHPLRAPARTALRGARAGDLPAHRSRGRAGLRPVQGWARRVIGPTGGYLLSYPIAAAVAGLATNATRGAAHRRALWTSLLWGCVGLTVIYALGATCLAFVTRLPFAAALAQGVAPFVFFDLIKVALAALVAVAASPAIATSRI